MLLHCQGVVEGVAAGTRFGGVVLKVGNMDEGLPNGLQGTGFTVRCPCGVLLI
jgi:hypothetical protein